MRSVLLAVSFVGVLWLSGCNGQGTSSGGRTPSDTGAAGRANPVPPITHDHTPPARAPQN